MLQVNYKLNIGKTTYTVSSQSRLLDLKVNASLNVPVNVCSFVLGTPEALSLSLKDPVSVELGYGNNLALVFSGTVSSVDWGIDRARIEAAGGFQALTRARFNLLYEKSNAGDIVKDVAQSRLKLAVSKVESGIKFPVYVLGDNQTPYEHLRTLADQCGFDLYADTQDKVVFAKYQSNTIHEFKYGRNILACDLEEQTDFVKGVQVYGESPASQGQGEQAYAWLTKQDVKGVAGQQSAGVERLFDPTARTQDIATKIAEATLAAKKQKRRGTVKVLGNSQVKLADGVKISQMPVTTHNGSFKAISITHVLSRSKGFCTTIHWEEA